MRNKLGTSGNMSEKYKFFILFLLTLSQLVMSLGAYAWGPLAPFLREDFGITRAQVGGTVSALYAVSVIIAMPAGLAVDKWGAKGMLIFALVTMGLSFCALSMIDSFTIFIVVASLSGIGYGMINQISSKGIISWFEKNSRATAMGIKQTGVTLGGAIGAIMIPVISISFNWHYATQITGVMILMTALVIVFFYNENPTKKSIKENKSLPETFEEHSSVRQNKIKILLMKPELVILCIVGMLLAGSQTCIASFLVLYMREELKLSATSAGLCLSIFMIAGTVGRVLWGIISDRVFKSDRQFPMILLCLIAFFSSIGMFSLNQSSSTLFPYVLSALMGTTFMGWNALFITFGAELAGPSLVGLVTGIMITVAWSGIIVGPLLFGIIADEAGYSWCWLILAALALVCSGLFVYSKNYSSNHLVKEAENTI